MQTVAQIQIEKEDEEEAIKIRDRRDRWSKNLRIIAQINLNKQMCRRNIHTISCRQIGGLQMD